MKTDYVIYTDYQYPTSGGCKAFSTSVDVNLLIATSPAESADSLLVPSLNTSLNDQALAYYVRYHIEVTEGWPEVSVRWDNHVKYALADQGDSQPQSVLSLAISAVSYATFGRARGSHVTLATGST